LEGLPGWRADTTVSGMQFVLETSDMPPIAIRFSNEGMAGVEGCFDTDLTNYWLIMQVRGLKSIK
jgi:hypothetical protein